MADLSIKIKADADEASRQFKELAKTSENLQEKIRKLGDDMGKDDANKLIEQQKIAAIAFKATGKEVEGLTKQKDAYERKIVSLINKGVDPASDAIQTLKKEIDNTNKELAKHGKYTGDAAKGVEAMGKAATVAAAALMAAGAAAIAMTQKTAEMGDSAAKAARSVGMTAETFQELDYAAKQSGVNDLSGSLQKLNKNMAGVRNGSGSLVTALKGTNDALLKQLNTAKSNEEAFDLMMQAIRDAPDEFTRTQIATAAFGNAGHEMINMALAGADGIAALREEAQKFGIVSNESAAASEKYMDAQARLKKALEGVQIIFTEKLFPIFTNIIDKVTEFISEIDNWDAVLKAVGITLGIVTVALGAFMFIVKGAALIVAFSKGLAVMTGAFKALNLAMAANPILGIVTAITAILIPAIILIVKNWDKVQTYLEQGIARLEFGFKWLGSKIKEYLIIAFNITKEAGTTLIDFIYGNIIRAVGRLLEVMGELPYVGKLFDAASQQVMRLGNAIGNLAEETRENSRQAIQAAREEQDATEEALRAKLAGIDKEANARRAAIEERRKASREEMDNDIAMEEARYAALIAINVKTNKEKLDLFKSALGDIDMTEKQAQADRIASLEQFFMARAEFEGQDAEDRNEFMRGQAELAKERLLAGLEDEREIALQREAIEIALQNSIMKKQEEAADRERELLEARANAAANYISDYGKLFSTLGKKNREFAILAKATAAAEAGINSALAFSKALANYVFPYSLIPAGAALAAGVAQQVAIWNTNIPSAETGGRFIMPDISPRLDDIGIRVNGGETIDVTPRGEEPRSNGTNVFQLVWNGKVLAEAINDLIDQGEIRFDRNV